MIADPRDEVAGVREEHVVVVRDRGRPTGFASQKSCQTTMPLRSQASKNASSGVCPTQLRIMVMFMSRW